MTKREFLELCGATAGLTALAACAPRHDDGAGHPAPAAELQPITGDVEPIPVEERLARVARA